MRKVEDHISEDSKLREVLDHHAPLRTIKIKGETSKPWNSDALHEAHQTCTNLECKHGKSGLEVNWQVVCLISHTNSSFCQEKVQHATNKETFQILVINCLLGASGEPSRPPADHCQAVVDSFVTFLGQDNYVIKTEFWMR